jgi:hypothetical protein
VDVYRLLGRDQAITIGSIPPVQQDSNDSQIYEELLTKIYQFLMDNKNHLKRKRMSKYPQVDCYSLFKQRLPVQDPHSNDFLEGKDWDETLRQLELDSDLRLELDSNLRQKLRQKLSRFYGKQCLPCLKRFLEDEGYTFSGS